MSGKKKRKTREVSEAVAVKILDDIRDASDDQDLSPLTCSLLQLISNNASERKVIIQRSSRGVETLIKTLQVTEEPQVVCNLLATFDCLAKHRYREKLVKRGLVPVILSSLASAVRCQSCSDDTLLLYHSLLLQLGSKDKQFAVLARLSGTLSVTVGLFKRCQSDHHAVVTTLGVIKILAGNATNAEYLGKHGFLSNIVKMFDGAARKNYIILKLCVDILTHLITHRSLCSKPSAQSCVSQLVFYHQHLHQIDSHCRHLPLRRSILYCLKAALISDACLDTFQRVNGLKILYSTASQSHAGLNCGKGLKSLCTITCMVLRKALPKVPLPISSKHNPIHFNFPSPAVINNIQCQFSSPQATEGRLHVSHSAPQLTGLLHTKEEETHSGYFSCMTKQVSSQLYSHLPSTEDQSDLQAKENSTNPSAPIHDESSSSSEATLGSNDVATDMNLSLFDKFFPELKAKKKADYIPNLTTIAPLVSEQTHESEVQHEATLRSVLKCKEGQLTNADRLSESTSDFLLRPIVIPTALSENRSISHTYVSAASEHSSNLPRLSQPGGVRSALQFSEIPAPQVLGHLNPNKPEPMYKKTPTIERSVTLEDTARFIDGHSIINRTVYDLDALVTMSSCERLPSQDIQSKAQGAEEADVEKSSEVEKVDGKDVTTVREASHNVEYGSNLSISPLCLLFDSQFESGNLRKVIQIREYEYDLLLNSDINSDHHHQWFYFKVSNMTGGIPYRFNVINCEKLNSQFNFGMQPLFYSVREATEGRPGWVRTAFNITYYKNNFFYKEEYDGQGEEDGRKKQKAHYTLTFSLNFPYSGDICYLAYHYPYTYSMLVEDIEEFERTVDDSVVFYQHQVLCTTLSGNPCPILTLTSQPANVGNEYPNTKEYIVLSARVHPGESNSSWVMKGILRYLFSEDPKAEELRKKFVFKIIPMLNPDGVIHGSHRCSLCGQDLNRKWIQPSSCLHPTVYHTKGIIEWLITHDMPPTVFCDFHGHSRKKNIFMYGCESENNSKIEEVLPRILASIAPYFSWRSCSFQVEKSKEGTARVVVGRRLGICHSYTMEATYCGTNMGPYKGQQITTEHLQDMGQYFCQSLAALKCYRVDDTTCEEEAGLKPVIVDRNEKEKQPKSEISSDSPTTDSENFSTEEQTADLNFKLC